VPAVSSKHLAVFQVLSFSSILDVLFLYDALNAQYFDDVVRFVAFSSFYVVSFGRVGLLDSRLL